MKTNYLKKIMTGLFVLLVSMNSWGQGVDPYISPNFDMCPGTYNNYYVNSGNYNYTRWKWTSSATITYPFAVDGEYISPFSIEVQTPTSGANFWIMVEGQNKEDITPGDGINNPVWVTKVSKKETINIYQKPVLSAITGTSYLSCGINAPQVFSVQSNSSVSKYTWTTGGWGISGNTTYSTITLLPVGNGSPTITAKGESAYCPGLFSDPVSKVVNRVPAKPTATIFPGPLFQGNTYNFQIASVSGATGYTWSVLDLPNATITSNGTSADIFFGTNGKGIVRVVANSPCGNSAPLDLIIDAKCNEPSTTAFDFCNPTDVGTQFVYNNGWMNESIAPRHVLDVNNDDLDDIVGFWLTGVKVALKDPNGPGFFTATQWTSEFSGPNWANELINPRMLVDVNNDKFPDIVGFANDNVWVALNKGDQGTGFKVAQPWYIGAFCVNNGWSDMNTYPRMLRDVNGDDYPDLVGFAEQGVVVAINKIPSTGVNGFKVVSGWSAFFGRNTGFSDYMNYPRMMADLNKDKMADIIGFTDAGVYVSLSKGTYFATPTLWSGAYEFGKLQGYENLDKHPRFVKDMNNDGFPDLVGFRNGVNVALNGNTDLDKTVSDFTPTTKWINDEFSFEYGGWDSNLSHPRLIGDVNGDLYPDIVGFNNNQIYTSLNQGGSSFQCPSKEFGTTYSAFTVNTGWQNQATYPRFLCQLDNDNRKEIIGFGGSYLKVMNDCNGGTDFRQGEFESTENTLLATEKLNCYPNPFTNNLTIDYKAINSSEATISIFNSIGSKIKEVKGVSGENTLSFSGENLENGTYFCILYENGKITAKKSVVLQK